MEETHEKSLEKVESAENDGHPKIHIEVDKSSSSSFKQSSDEIELDQEEIEKK